MTAIKRIINKKNRVNSDEALAACNWWLRSVNATNTNNFCNVNTDGSANNNNANNSLGVASGFNATWTGISRLKLKAMSLFKGEFIRERVNALN